MSVSQLSPIKNRLSRLLEDNAIILVFMVLIGIVWINGYQTGRHTEVLEQNIKIMESLKEEIELKQLIEMKNKVKE